MSVLLIYQPCHYRSFASLYDT